MAEETISLFIRAFTSMQALGENDKIEVTLWLCSCFSFRMSDDDENNDDQNQKIGTDILEQSGVCALPQKADVEMAAPKAFTEHDHGIDVLGQNGICESQKTANVETDASDEVSKEYSQFQNTVQQPDFPTPENPRRLPSSQSLEEIMMHKRSRIEETILSKEASKRRKMSLDQPEFTKFKSPQVTKSYFSHMGNVTTSTVVQSNLASSKVMQAGANSLSVDKTIEKSRYFAVPSYFQPVSSSTPIETSRLKSRKRLWNAYTSKEKYLDKDNQRDSAGQSHECIDFITPTYSSRQSVIVKEQQTTSESKQVTSSRHHFKSEASEKRFEKSPNLKSENSEESKDYANSSSVLSETISERSDGKCDVSTKCYSSSSTEIMHRQLNELDSMSMCRECGEKITASNKQIHFNHMKLGFRRFHCDWCSKAFVWKETLIRHCISSH